MKRRAEIPDVGDTVVAAVAIANRALDGDAIAAMLVRRGVEAEEALRLADLVSEYLKGEDW